MSWTPTRAQLGGLSLDVAECYGKPHIGAHYTNSHVKSHKPDWDAVCAVCRRRIGSVHHIPPLSKGHTFTMKTPVGQFVLRPSLFALCGNGTMGCHNGFHGGALYKARWKWDSDEYARMWWEGEFLRRMRPHSRELYRYGCWVIEDIRNGWSIEVRK